jgi:hypothetical protein
LTFSCDIIALGVGGNEVIAFSQLGRVVHEISGMTCGSIEEVRAQFEEVGGR